MRQLPTLARDGIALALALTGIAGILVLVMTTAVAGEWGRLIPAAVGAVLLLAARALGRYDPEEAAVARATEQAPAAELRNRTTSG